MDKIIGLRWFSWSNPWMDVVYLVRNEDWSVATKAIKNGVELFWSLDDACYGDCIEVCLQSAHINYVADYEDASVGGDDYQWGKRLADYHNIGVEIFEVEA